MLTELVQPRVSRYVTDSQGHSNYAEPIFWALTFGVFVQILGLLAMIIVAYLDKRNEQSEIARSMALNESIDESDQSILKASIYTRTKQLGTSYAYFALLITFEFICMVPFKANLNLLLQTRFQIDSVQAGNMIVSLRLMINYQRSNVH